MKKQLTIYLSIAGLLLLLIGAIFFFLNESEIKSTGGTHLVEVEPKVENPDLIVEGVHVRTGLVDAVGLQEVITNCTTCHSSKLIIQNRMGKEQWNATIRWMQETQGLWDLGENQKIIVDYLTTNYPTFKKGRRAALTDIEWYPLDTK
ncbi:monoheme cytochrome C [Maribacter algicola]|uniref:Monoheme cytochrome C n=1 Tax=Maribacter algicola TaxID=2498892 RepID=A0A3R8PYH0_9FLAO|nr:monoheme cytochrome C [Maribacter algicola]RRQ48550.1 monoheme cytochrome C [Maribacter algicola]